MMKKIVLILIVFSFINILNVSYANQQIPVTVRVNNQIIESQDPNIIVDDRVFVLARDISESLGALVQWNNYTRQVAIVLDDRVIKMNIDSFTADVNGEIKVMDTMPFLYNDRAYVPVRFLSESLGCEVEWDGINRIVDINEELEATSRGETITEDSYTKEDLLWLSRIVQVETGGSTIDMKLAVANVVLNRVKSNIFPDSIHDVIFEIDVYVQFPPAHRESFPTLYPSELSIEAARRALEGENNIEDCLYFNNSPFKTKTDDLYKVIDGEYFYH